MNNRFSVFASPLKPKRLPVVQPSLASPTLSYLHSIGNFGSKNWETVEESRFQGQVIDEEGSFHYQPGDDERLCSDSDFEYNVVSIVGSQSTGKSTLLNLLFNTTFDTMSAAQRKKTTKGIWMCRDVEKKILILDIEGADSRENGEDSNFERKAAFFALVCSHVLLINMWEKSIGLFEGANSVLLRTIFEAYIGDAEAPFLKRKTLLMFVIRDYEGYTPSESNEATITDHLLKIWSSIHKRPELELHSFFDTSFVHLHHKNYQSQDFTLGVGKMRERFTNSSHPEYIFKHEYRSGMSAHDLPHYMEQIWSQVQNQKDLNIPSRTELLHYYHCCGISRRIRGSFTTMIRAHGQHTGVIDKLGRKMTEWKDQALRSFDTDTAKYKAAGIQNIREDLIGFMHDNLYPLFRRQIHNLHRESVADFEKEVKKGISSESYQFWQVIHCAQNHCKHSFQAQAEEALVLQTDWTFQGDLELLDGEVMRTTGHFRSQENVKSVNQIGKNLLDQISRPVARGLKNPSSTMWSDLVQVYRDKIQSAERAYVKKAKYLQCDDKEEGKSRATLRDRAREGFIQVVHEGTTDDAIRRNLERCFGDIFQLDHRRKWYVACTIDSVYHQARTRTLDLLPLYAAKIVPKVEHPLHQIDTMSAGKTSEQTTAQLECDPIEVLSPERKEQMTAWCEKWMEETYKRETSSIDGLPKIPWHVTRSAGRVQRYAIESCKSLWRGLVGAKDETAELVNLNVMDESFSEVESDEDD